jgi:hypothetical protein
LDVLGLEAEADDAGGEVLEAGDPGEDAQGERRSDRAGVVQHAVEHLVGEGLEALGAADGGLAVGLDVAEVPVGEGAGAERFGEDLGRGDGVLERDVDADATDGGHGVGCIADAEEAGKRPAFEVIDLDGEQLDLVPGVEAGGAAGEEWGDALNTFAEGRKACLLDLGKGSFGDDVGGLEVLDAIDEDEETAVVDVAESAFGVVRVARDAEPEDVDGDAFLDDVEMSGGDGGGVAAVAADGERGVDFGGAVGGVGGDAGDAGGVGGIGLDETGCLPAHAEREAGVMCGFGGEEVEEVPLWRERDVFADGGEVGAVGYRKVAAPDVDGDALDDGVADGGEEAIKQAELVEELEGGGVDGVAAEVAEEVGVLLEDGDFNAGAGEQEAEHDSGRASADDAAGGVEGGGGHGFASARDSDDCRLDWCECGGWRG